MTREAAQVTEVAAEMKGLAICQVHGTTTEYHGPMTLFINSTKNENLKPAWFSTCLTLVPTSPVVLHPPSAVAL